LLDSTRSRTQINQGKSPSRDQVIPAEWVKEPLRPAPSVVEICAGSGYAELFPQGSYHDQIWPVDAAKGIFVMLGNYGQIFYADIPTGLEIVGFSSYPRLTSNLMAIQLKELWSTITDMLSG
jgi:CubicO group peptidase (beta-lactamase class C family)